MYIINNSLDTTNIRKGGKGKKLTKITIKDLQAHPRSKSEQSIIALLEKLTGKSFPTVYLPWLTWAGAQMELDGYNDSIAIEYNGPHHTKWVPSREDYLVYYNRIIKDKAKIKLCARHGVGLIVVDYTIPRERWSAYLRSRLYDLGAIDARPPDYIDEVKVKPYRDRLLEKEMGLGAEMKALAKL
jgi:hypothetical protein